MSGTFAVLDDSRDFDPATIDRRVLIDLVNDGTVDCGRVVQIIQLMTMPEFNAFFSALCEISIADAAHAADALAQCAEALHQEKVSVTEVVNMVLGRRALLGWS